MNVLQNLVEFYNQQPVDGTYREVAGRMLQNLPEMADLTVYEIADLTSSSRTTIWRMVQKMGYESFKDFHHALQGAVRNYPYYNRVLVRAEDSEDSDPIRAAADMLRGAADILESQITPERVNELAEQMHMAEKIRFYLPFHLFGAYSLQQNLAMAGKDTAFLCLFTEMMKDAKTLGNDSIAILCPIDHAETQDMRPVFRELREREAEIWLAGGKRSMYRKYADRVILDMDIDPFGATYAFESLLLAVSKTFRSRYLDR